MLTFYIRHLFSYFYVSSFSCNFCGMRKQKSSLVRKKKIEKYYLLKFTYGFVSFIMSRQLCG